MKQRPLFDVLGLPTPLLEALSQKGYTHPSSVQEESIPVLLSGKDLLAQAQTGTGKTAAFALPLLAKLDPELRKPQALILAPTRELALQVAESFESYAKHLPKAHILPVYGGQSYEQQLRAFKQGAQVIVGTPGRVQDHIKRGSLDLKHLKTLVLDEADEMLRMGFIDDVQWIIEQAKPCQMAMFSATMPPPIKKITSRYLEDPHEIVIPHQVVNVGEIEEHHMILGARQKHSLLPYILEGETFDGALVFVETRLMTTEVTNRLTEKGISAAALNGDMDQKTREQTIEHLKSKRIDVLVATDVAARGLDVDRIDLVVNYNRPYDVASYVHRIGRTGRAGRKGKALLLLTPKEQYFLKKIHQQRPNKLQPMEPPTNATIELIRRQQLQRAIHEALASEELVFFEEFAKEFKQETGISYSKMIPALVYLAQKHQPLQVSESLSQMKSLKPMKGSKPLGHGSTKWKSSSDGDGKKPRGFQKKRKSPFHPSKKKEGFSKPTGAKKPYRKKKKGNS